MHHKHALKSCFQLIVTLLLATQATAEVPAPCVDTDGDGWGWNGVASCRITSFRLHGSDTPVIASRGDSLTSSQVLRWRTEDLADNTVQCAINTRCIDFCETSDQVPSAYQTVISEVTFLSTGAGLFLGYSDNLAEPQRLDFNWSVSVAGKLTGLPDPQDFDLNSAAYQTDNGYLFIQEFQPAANGISLVEKYTECLLLDTTSPLRATGQPCVDADGDGWGWNGTDSCRVALTADPECDYSAAQYNDGWGYNASTGLSCTPNPENSGFTPEDQCDYSLANNPSRNGWGWNPARQESCPPPQPI